VPWSRTKMRPGSCQQSRGMPPVTSQRPSSRVAPELFAPPPGGVGAQYFHLQKLLYLHPLIAQRQAIMRNAFCSSRCVEPRSESTHVCLEI